MSRRKPADNSTAVSLFPFLAVLLCTMGALLVVLVAVSRAAREAAMRENAAQPQAPSVEIDPELQRELERIEQFKAGLKQVRNQAEQRLREDQLRLGQLESHMRRLHDELALLQAAAAELDALEEEHYDDREQAEREVQRLQRLIAETRDAVEELKDQITSQKHKYALVPYEGPNGTYRRPLYIECRKNELILQPEGVRVTRDDLYPPYGAGNPLSSAIRAARNYYVQLNSTEGQSRAAEPYPLLVVRPDGLIMYDRARRAIEASDFDFGFELVESDWELKYPVADPKLATLEQQAIDLARIRQRALAAAAPRAYRRPAFAAGEFEFGDEGEMGFGEASGGEFGDSSASGEDAIGGYAGGGTAQSGGDAAQSRGDGSTDFDPYSSAHSGDAPRAESTGQGEPASSNEYETASQAAATAGTAAAGSATATASPQSPAAGGASGEAAMEPSFDNQIVASNGAPSHERPEDTPPSTIEVPRGRDWALGRKKPNAVPVRRTIQVVVRGEEVAILADDAQVDSVAPPAKRIPIQGDTVQSLDQVVAAVRAQIEGWGMAGNGLYWRPVLILNIGPDGQRRADDLQRLLKDSGIELRVAEIISNRSQRQTGATQSR